MNTTTDIQIGSEIQYRKVGRGIVNHIEQTAESGAALVRITWKTGRYVKIDPQGQKYQIWIGPRDLI